MSELLVVRNDQVRLKEMPAKSHETVKYFVEAGNFFGLAAEHDSCLVQATPSKLAADLAHDLDWYGAAIRRPTITIPCGIFSGMKPAVISRALGEVNNFLDINSTQARRALVIFKDVHGFFGSGLERDNPNQLKASTLVMGYLGSLTMAEGPGKPLVCAIGTGNAKDMPGAEPLLEIFNAQCTIASKGETTEGNISIKHEPASNDHILTALDRVAAAKFGTFAAQIAAMGISQVAEV